MYVRVSVCVVCIGLCCVYMLCVLNTCMCLKLSILGRRHLCKLPAATANMLTLENGKKTQAGLESRNKWLLQNYFPFLYSSLKKCISWFRTMGENSPIKFSLHYPDIRINWNLRKFGLNNRDF